LSSIRIPARERKDSKDIPKVLNFFELKLKNQRFSSVNEFSDGTLTVIAMLLTLLSKELSSTLLFIEEPENYLHPKALKTLVSYLQQRAKYKQILITTHSPYLLNNVKPEDVTVARLEDDGGARFGRIENIKQLRRRLARGFISFGDLLYVNFKNDDEPGD
jgi:predicted ATPase